MSPCFIPCTKVALLLCVALSLGAADAPTQPSWLDARLRGFTTPNRQVELDAPLEEVLASIAVAEGDRVQAGAELARLDDQLQAVVVDAARVQAQSVASVRRAELDLESADTDLERLTAAFERSAASDLELRRARIARGQAEAALTAARENHVLAEVNLRLEERRLERYRIRAPFDGTVIRIIAETGARLNDNDSILVLADLDTLEARVDLPVGLYGALEIGGTYRFWADQPVNAMIDGRLRMIVPVIETASQTFRCIFEIDNEQRRLPAGFNVFLEWRE